MTIEEALKSEALNAGFDLAGVAPIEAPQELEFARQWVEAGRGGEMQYLSNPRRHDPRRVLPSARSVICVGLQYNTAFPYSTEVAAASSGSDGATGGSGKRPSNTSEDAPPRAWISRYAWGRDYHKIMRGRLENFRRRIESLAPGVETRVYVDTGPVVERAFTRLSGIGWTGKNTCIINQQKGSWFFLGVVLTNLALRPDVPAPDRCGSCRRCLDACPTGALAEPYVMDASRCIAYLTIELKSSIPEQYREGIGNNVFGCDICQDVCPWNAPDGVRPERQPEANHARRRAVTNLPAFQPLDLPLAAELRQDVPSPTATSLFNPPLEALASLTEEQFRSFFRHSPIKRAKYRGWLRNLCVAIGNSGDARFVPWLEETSRCADEILREHAQWALARLRRNSQIGSRGQPSFG